MSAVIKEPSIPQGKLKVLNIADIVVDKRFREDLGEMDILVESIKDKGVFTPITVSTDMHLISGGRRLAAAKLAGLLKIPALLRKLEGEVDAREIELMENVHRKDFEWPEEAALVAEIDRLYKAKHIDWIPAAEGRALKPGWSTTRTAELLNKSVSSVQRALQLAQYIEAVPELAEYKTASDALKVIDKMQETVMVEELRSRQKEDVLRLSEGGLEKGIRAMLVRADANYQISDVFAGLAGLRTGGVVNVIECDPPYGIDLTQLKASKDNVASSVHDYNEIPATDYGQFLTKLAAELYRVAGRDCWLVFWFGPTWQREVLVALREAQWKVDEIPCIWVKNQGQTMQPEMYLGRAYEPFYLARKGNPALMKRGRLNVFQFAGTPSSQKYHPTERPVPLIEEILNTLTVASGVVLVPFLGSGATIRAAYNLGMKIFGFDMSDQYKDKFMLAIEEDARKLSGANEPELDGVDETEED